MARARLETCPACRRSLPDFGDWPAWCPECGWGISSDDTSATDTSRFKRWWRRRTDAAEQSELQRLLANPALLPRPHPRRFAIYAAAAAVHLTTLAILATGAWIMTTGVVGVIKIGAGIVIFGLIFITFPMYRLRPSKAARKADAPTTLAVAATVAAAVGVAAPDRARARSNGQPLPPTSGRVLTVDLDRWQGLDAPGRIALLAHERAHHNGHDPRRSMLVILASETLDGWVALLRQDPRTAARRQNRTPPFRARAAGPPMGRGLVGLSELLIPLVIAPVYVIVFVLRWVLRESGVVAGLRAELYADALAVEISGLYGTTYVDGLIGGTLGGVPDLERERRRRLAVMAGRRSGPMHPTYAARLEMLAALAQRPSAPRTPVAISSADLEAMTRELVALSTPNE